MKTRNITPERELKAMYKKATGKQFNRRTAGITEHNGVLQVEGCKILASMSETLSICI